MKFIPIKKFLNGPVINSQMPFALLPRPTAPLPSGDSDSSDSDEEMKPLPRIVAKPIDINTCDQPTPFSTNLNERIAREISNKVLRGWTATPSKKFYIRWSHKNFKAQSRPVTAEVVDMFRSLFLEAKQKKLLVRKGTMKEDEFIRWSNTKINAVNNTKKKI